MSKIIVCGRGLLPVNIKKPFHVPPGVPKVVPTKNITVHLCTRKTKYSENIQIIGVSMFKVNVEKVVVY